MRLSLDPVLQVLYVIPIPCAGLEHSFFEVVVWHLVSASANFTVQYLYMYRQLYLDTDKSMIIHDYINPIEVKMLTVEDNLL